MSATKSSGPTLLGPADAARMRRARLKEGLTLKQAAAAAGVSHPYWSAVEQGRKGANLARLRTMLAVVGLDVQCRIRLVRRR